MNIDGSGTSVDVILYSEVATRVEFVAGGAIDDDDEVRFVTRASGSCAGASTLDPSAHGGQVSNGMIWVNLAGDVDYSDDGEQPAQRLARAARGLPEC